MSRRAVKKPTRWSEAEWAHVADQARRAGIPALRYVREAALGIRKPAKFAPGATGTAVSETYRPSDDVVIVLARLLAALRTLEALASTGGDDASPSDLAQAVEAAIKGAPAACPARLEGLRWTVLPYGEALASIVQTMAARGAAPAPHVLASLLRAVRSGLETA